MPRPSSRRGDDALPDEPEGIVSSSKHRKCCSLREWLLEGLRNQEPPLYRSRSLPEGYSFRFVRSLGRILLSHDNGVVVLDTVEVLDHDAVHLSFLYGPLELLWDPAAASVQLPTMQLLEAEPSNTVGMPGCIPVLVAPREAEPSNDDDDFALARALAPETARDAASARAGRAPRCLGRSRSAVPATAPSRPRASGLEACLEQANLKAFTHLFHKDVDDTFVAKTISDGQTTPLIYALDRLRKTPWDCSKSLMSLNSMIVRLMENRADLNATVPPDRESPLQLLLRASHMEGELVQLCKSRLAVMMLRLGADVNHVDSRGESPLSEAAMAGDVEMCRLLLDHGANVSTLRTSEAGNTGWKDLTDLSLDRKVQMLLHEAEKRQKHQLSDLLTLGRSHLTSKSSSRAQLCFLQALKIDPLNPELLLAKAEADFLAGAFEKAYRDASKVAALCPSNGSAYELCARSLWHLNRLDEALCICRSLRPAGEQQVLSRLEERMVKHRDCLDAAEEMLKDVSNQRNAALLERSFKDLDCLLCDLDETERCSAWGKLIRLAFVKVCVFPLLAVQAECMDNTWAQRAVVETRQLRKKDPKCGELLYWYARALLRLGGCRQDALGALSGCHPPSTMLRRALEEAQMQCRSAEAAAKQHLWQKALRCYEEAENKVSHYDPDLTASVLTEKAAILLHLERTQEALERLTLALEIRGRVARPRYMRGVVHMALDQYQQAACDFDVAYELDPKVHPKLEEERTRAQRWARCPPVPDHYAALGIKNTANSVQVKKAYRLAALRWHPDKNVGQEALAEQAFKQIQQAFEVLSDPQRRKHYDEDPAERKAWKFAKTKDEPR